MRIQIFLLVFWSCVYSSAKRVTLGGIFPENDLTEKAFNLAIKKVNRDRHDSEDLSNIFFVNETIHDEDVFEISQNVCTLLRSSNVVALFGPQDRASSGHVNSICDTMDVPNIVARWDSDLVRMNAINLYPHAESLSLIYLNIVTQFNWKSFTILYDSIDGLIRMNYLLKKWDSKGYPVTLRHLGNTGNYRGVLKRVKNSGEENIVIDCSLKILDDVLKQALQVGILSDRHKVIVNSLDLQTLDLEPYQYTGANFTGVRILNPDEQDPALIFDHELAEMGLEDLSKLPLEAALMFDAVYIFARAFKRFKDAVKGDARTLDCTALDSWEHGTSLSNFIRDIEMKGLTGLIKFHTNGFRSDFQLDIVKLDENGIGLLGIWNSTSNEIEWAKSQETAITEGEMDMANQTFKVLIALADPYNMLKESSTKRTGNDRYEGFAIDIIQELSKILHFNYTFEEGEKSYGNEDPKTGKWDGLIGQLMRFEGDLAITDLTITAEREKAVDFTMPFMNLGISILYKKPTKKPPSLFSFVSPFSEDVWISLFITFTLVSLLLFIIGRLCPAEWTNPYPCIEEPETLQNQLTLQNSFWFTIGAFMQQGSEIAPIGASTRMLAGSWWFFCLILINSYTANLAAFLTVETTDKPIQSADDLATKGDQGLVKYGAKRGGATFNFFKGSNDSTYRTMYRYMDTHKEHVMTDDNDMGKSRVIKEDGGYAFLMESSSIEYIQQRECGLTMIGGMLDQKGYGIAMRKYFPYRNKLNTAVLYLQETGLLSQLKKKWWEEKRGGGKCTDDAGGASAGELTLDNVGGVFLVLSIGCAVSLALTTIEMLWDILWTSHNDNLPFKEELIEEIKFVAKCKGTVKPVRNRKDSSRSTGQSTRDGTPPYGFVPIITTTHDNDS